MATKARKQKKVKEYGHYVVADPKICHGALTFRGTRIFVRDVLEQVAEGMPWHRIIWEWRGSVTRAAIAEAIAVARDALLREESRVKRSAA